MRLLLLTLLFATAHAAQEFVVGGFTVDTPGRYPFMVSIQVGDMLSPLTPCRGHAVPFNPWQGTSCPL